MNYELAKQLKDAGFPQITNNHDYYTNVGMIFRMWSTRPLKGDEIFIPTLSELIKACGDEFISLDKLVHEEKNNWKARGKITKSKLVHIAGSTPEEAVAKLWLELNK